MTFPQQSTQQSMLSQVNFSGNAVIPGLITDGLGGSGRSILFIDSGVADIQTLVNGAAVGTEVHVLREGDAIDQITQTLLGRSGIESLQIVSHGRSGGVQLGAS